MAKNTKHTRGANVVIPITKASVSAGDVVHIGDQGMIGYALTDTYDASAYTTTSTNVPPQGLDDGDVSVEIVGVSRAVELTVAGGVDLGDPVFVDGSGDYTATATDNNFVGYALEDIGAGNAGLVGLIQFVPAAVTT